MNDPIKILLLDTCDIQACTWTFESSTILWQALSEFFFPLNYEFKFPRKLIIDQSWKLFNVKFWLKPNMQKITFKFSNSAQLNPSIFPWKTINIVFLLETGASLKQGFAVTDYPNQNI